MSHPLSSGVQAGRQTDRQTDGLSEHFSCVAFRNEGSSNAYATASNKPPPLKIELGNCS